VETITLRKLTDLDARMIASGWYAGMMSGLYALSSSGAVVVNGDYNATPATHVNAGGELVLTADPDTLARLTAVEEIDAILEDGTEDTTENIADLVSLKAYVLDSGPRGPVAGWANLNW
jgi:hypothetical protein